MAIVLIPNDVVTVCFCFFFFGGGKEGKKEKGEERIFYDLSWFYLFNFFFSTD